MNYSLGTADMVLDHQEASHELDDSVRVKVREALLKRHHHQNEKKKNLIPIVRSIAEGTRKQSEPHLAGGIHTVLHMETHMSFIDLLDNHNWMSGLRQVCININRISSVRDIFSLRLHKIFYENDGRRKKEDKNSQGGTKSSKTI